MQEIWNGRSDKMYSKETKNGQLHKPQLPEMNGGKRSKHIKENDTTGERGFSGRSSATGRLGKGSLKRFHQWIEKRQTVVQSG